MKLIVGLGNPGAKYAGNRHNIGFMAVDAIQTDHGFAPWRKRFRGRTAEGTLDGVKVLLLKPDTYMNESGRSVAEVARFLKIKPADIIVFHDELDLAPGKFRTRIGGGHAGHNGLRSITNHLGNAFARVRLGIGHPGRKDLVAGYVLKDFAKADGTWLTPLLDDIAREAGLLAKGELERFQTAVSQRLADRSGAVSPAPPSPGRSGRVDLGRPGQRGRAQGSAGRSETKSDGRPSGRPSQRELAARAASSSGRAAPKRARTQPTQKREEAPEQVASPAADASPKTALGQKLTEQLGRLFSRKTDGS